MRKLVPAVMVLSVALAACTTSSNGSASTTTTSQLGTRVAPSEPADTSSSTSLIGLPGSAGVLEGNILLGCGASGPMFPASALDSTIPLEDARYAFVTEAMASFLDSGEGAFWPQSGWRILHETDSDILVVHIGGIQGDRAVSFMTVSLRDGEWRWDGSQVGGPCELTTSPPAGLNRVDWRLDPQFDVDGSFIELPLLVSELECASGQEMGDRLLAPEVIETDQAVFIAFAAMPDDADAHTCQGNPETPVVVQLAAPLGDRELKDGLKLAGFLSDYIGGDFGLDS